MVRRNAWTYKVTRFSVLSLSLLAGVVYAQEASNTAADATAVPEALVSKPVVVNQSLAPTAVPVQSSGSVSSKLAKSEVEADEITAADDSSSASGATVDSERSADGTVSTSKNSNATGTQIIINNHQAADQKSDLSNGNESTATAESGADVLRRERLRTELKNEGRLLEKIEEGRINTELKRSEKIEGVDLSGADSAASAKDVDTAQVAAVAVDGPAQVQIAQASNSSTAAIGETAILTSSSSNTRGKLSLYGGYRWMPDHNEFASGYDVQNLGYISGAFETKLANALAIEGTVGFGRDRITTPFYGFNPMYQDPYYYARSRDVFDVGANAKLGYLKGNFQPFVMAGIGATYQKYNIDDMYTLADADYAGWSRSSTRLIGNLGAGIDFAFNSNIGFGVRYEYNYVFNKHYNPMDGLYGDSHDRMKVIGGLQINF